MTAAPLETAMTIDLDVLEHARQHLLARFHKTRLTADVMVDMNDLHTALSGLPELLAAARERDAMRAELDLWHAGKLTLTTMPDGRPCIMHHRDDPNAEIRDPDTGEVLFPAVKAPFRVIENEARQALNQEQPA